MVYISIVSSKLPCFLQTIVIPTTAHRRQLKENITYKQDDNAIKHTWTIVPPAVIASPRRGRGDPKNARKDGLPRR